MRSTAIAAFCIGLFLLTAGCRTNQNLVLLERENRDLESALFELEYKLEVCREENAALRDDAIANRTEKRAAGPALAPEADRSELDIEKLQPPSVELGPPSSPLPERFRSPRQPDTHDLPEAPPYEPPSTLPPKPSLAPPGGPSETSHEQSAEFQDGPKLPLADSNLVTGLIIDSKRTGGFDADGDSGADGVVTVIQTRGEDDRPLRAAGPISVVVLDPALPGEAARVARWDFGPDEVARSYDRWPSAEGLKLRMPWPGKPPVNNRLHMFVRYTTGDGRQYESDSVLRVDLPGHPAQGWSSTEPAESEPQVASRAATDWRRRQVRERSPTPVQQAPKPLPVVKEPVRTASRPVEPATVPDDRSAPAKTARRVPAWSPER